jgi:hypothetical protein
LAVRKLGEKKMESDGTFSFDHVGVCCCLKCIVDILLDSFKGFRTVGRLEEDDWDFGS